MRTRTLILIMLGALVLSNLLHHLLPPRPVMPLPEVATNAPPFSWQDFSGATHALADLAGKPVVIHFWAAWCGNCKEEFPDLVKAAQEEKGVVFILVAGDRKVEDSEKFLRVMKADDAHKPANIFNAFDADKKITYDVFQTVYYPETILLDKNHIMRWKGAGTLDWQGAEMRQRLAGLSQ